MPFDASDKKYINTLKISDERGNLIKPAGTAEVYQSLGMFIGIPSTDPSRILLANPNYLGSFNTLSGENVAILLSDKVAININKFPNVDMLKAIMAACPGAISYADGDPAAIFTISNGTNPPISFEPVSGTLSINSVIGTPPAQSKILCEIGPLGVYSRFTRPDGVEETIDGRTKAEDFIALSNAEAQQRIVNADFSPEFFQKMLAKGDRDVQPILGRNGKRVNVNQIPMQMLDLYFKKVSEDPTNADSNGAYHFPPIDTTTTPPRRTFESEYSITAIPSGTGKFIYIAKRNDSSAAKQTMAIYDGTTGKFQPFSKFNFVQDRTGKPMVSFISKNGKIHRYAEIPLEAGSTDTLNGKFLNSVVSFIEHNPQTEMPNKVINTLGTKHSQKSPSADDKTLNVSSKLYSLDTVTLNQAEDSVARELVTDEIKEVTVKTNASHIVATPPPPSASRSGGGAKPLANAPGNRKNPYVEPPKKEIKKPVKLNEDWIKYGGFFLGFLLIAIGALVLGPVFGGIVATLGVGIMAGSQVAALKIQQIKDNPLTTAFRDYTNGLAHAEQEAEKTAQKFWENETEFGKYLDEYNAKIAELSDPSAFAAGGKLEYVQHLIDSGLITSDTIKEFLADGNSNQRNSYSNDLKEIRALWDKQINNPTAFTPAEKTQLKALQDNFMRSFGFKVNDTNRAALFDDSQFDNMGRFITAIDELDVVERAKNASHDEVSDIIQNCTHEEFMKILKQPNVNVAQFVEEHKLDIARRLAYRTDLSDASRDELLQKMPTFTETDFRDCMQVLNEGHAEVESFAMAQAVRELRTQKVDDVLKILEKVTDFAVNGDKNFDEHNNTLLTDDNLTSSMSSLLQSIRYEDLKRNTQSSPAKPNLSLLSEAILTPTAKTAADASSNVEDGKIKDILENASGDLMTKIQSCEDSTKDNFINYLKNEVYQCGGIASILSSNAYSEIGGSSIENLAKFIQGKLSTSDATIDDVVNAYNDLNRAKKDASTAILGHEISKLKINSGVTHADMTSVLDADIDARVTELKKYSFFDGLDDAKKKDVARMYIAAETKLTTKLEADIASARSSGDNSRARQLEKQLENAQKELGQHMESICSGDYINSLIAQRERESFENAHGTNIPPRSQARAPIDNMISLLEELEIPMEDRKKYIEKASIAQADNSRPLDLKTLCETIIDTNKNSQYFDMSKPGVTVIRHMSELGDLSIPDPITKETIKKMKALRTKLKNTRKASERANMQELQNKVGIKIGQEQATRGYKKAFKKALQGETLVDLDEVDSTKSASGNRDRGARKIDRAVNNEDAFIGKFLNVVDKLNGQDHLKLFTTLDTTVADITRQTEWNDINSDLRKMLSKKAVQDMFKEAGIAGIKSWEDIKNKLTANAMDADTFNKLRSRIIKLLNDKLKKLKEKTDKKIKAAKKERNKTHKRFFGKKSRDNATDSTLSAFERKKDREDAHNDLASEVTRIGNEQTTEEAKYSTSAKGKTNISQEH